MYLYTYLDGGLTQQTEEPTEDDYESADLGAIQIVRVNEGVFQYYDSDEDAWVDVTYCTDQDRLWNQ